jgi:hypothetical protein
MIYYQGERSLGYLAEQLDISWTPSGKGIVGHIGIFSVGMSDLPV